MTETRRGWQAEQQSEAGYWLRRAQGIVDGATPQLDFYQWRSDQLVKQLRGLGYDDLTSGSAHIIEVGCGPVGVGSCFPAASRLLVDPLEPTYSANEILAEMRNPEADYREGSGEAIPAPDDHFDLVIARQVRIVLGP